MLLIIFPIAAAGEKIGRTERKRNNFLHSILLGIVFFYFYNSFNFMLCCDKLRCQCYVKLRQRNSNFRWLHCHCFFFYFIKFYDMLCYVKLRHI